MIRSSLLALSLAMLAGCANTVQLEVAFPSENAVLISRSAEVTVVALEPGMLAVCPTLLGTGATDPLYEETIPVCDLRSHPLADPGSGPVAILVRVADASNTTILEGCSVGEVYPGRGTFVVDLYPTSAYAAAAATSTPPPGTTVSSYCGGGT